MDGGPAPPPPSTKGQKNTSKTQPVVAPSSSLNGIQGFGSFSTGGRTSGPITPGTTSLSTKLSKCSPCPIMPPAMPC